MTSKQHPLWKLETIREHLAAGLPFVKGFGLTLEEATPGYAVVSLRDWAGGVERPGGIVAGPALFGMADAAAYALVLAASGDPASTTVEMGIRFLRPAKPPLVAMAVPLKIGRRLFTIEVRITPEGNPDLVLVQATTTYALTAAATRATEAPE